MIDEKQIAQPSKREIAKGAVIALAAAVVVLVTAVLPAEYGIDPLRTGAALGLTELSEAAQAQPVAPVAAGVYTPQLRTYKVDAEDMLLVPGQGVEIKYHMEKGAVMVYSWKANGKLRFEFHGEPDQKPNPDYYDSYELDDKAGREASYGSFVAPSTGIHGWFWENKTGQDIEFRLNTAGFYDSAKMFAGGPPDDLPVEDVK